MKIREIKVLYQEYEHLSDCEPEDRRLVEHARKALENSYAPYSMYQVGAAIELSNGEILSASNQENVAYPSGICAERTVLFYAQSKYPEASVKAIAVTAVFNGEPLSEPVTPCGACRQVMAEYEARHQTKMKIIMASNSGKVYITYGIESLLPLLFKADNLKKIKK